MLADLYLVTSRYEGGPQSIVECGLTKTPIISTDVGLAYEILNPKSYTKNIENILDCEYDIDWAYQKSLDISIKEKGFKPYWEMFRRLHGN